MKNLIEIWKPVVGWEDYYMVSSLGRVKSLDRTYITNNRWGKMMRLHKGEILKPRKNDDGYLEVTLYKNGVRKIYKIHRLMCLAFLPNPHNLPEVNHKNKIRDFNLIWFNQDGSIDIEKSNLEWCDRKTNNLNREYKKTKQILQLTKSGKLVKKWNSVKEITQTLNTTKSNIWQCIKGKSKSALNSVWKLYEKETYLIALMNKNIM